MIGEFRAPRSRRLDTYYWFCLEHVRSYNAGWDYFAGMSQIEIEWFQREAVTGHRPTWRMNHGPGNGWSQDGIADHFGLFGGNGGAPGDAGSERDLRLNRNQRSALAELNLDASVTLQEIKMRYKQLVKRYHPDANGGDKAAEERFKSISEAYNSLLTSGLW